MELEPEDALNFVFKCRVEGRETENLKFMSCLWKMIVNIYLDQFKKN
jgi:hypothetical protein